MRFPDDMQPLNLVVLDRRLPRLIGGEIGRVTGVRIRGCKCLSGRAASSCFGVRPNVKLGRRCRQDDHSCQAKLDCVNLNLGRYIGPSAWRRLPLVGRTATSCPRADTWRYRWRCLHLSEEISDSHAGTYMRCTACVLSFLPLEDRMACATGAGHDHHFCVCHDGQRPRPTGEAQGPFCRRSTACRQATYDETI